MNKTAVFFALLAAGVVAVTVTVKQAEYQADLEQSDFYSIPHLLAGEFLKDCEAAFGVLGTYQAADRVSQLASCKREVIYHRCVWQHTNAIDLNATPAQRATCLVKACNGLMKGSSVRTGYDRLGRPTLGVCV